MSERDIFLTLIRENERIIFKICHTYCLNKNDREDLAQEIIYQLWKSYGKYQPSYRFSTWMYRIALNVAISFYRRGRTMINTAGLPEHILEMEDSRESHSTLEENIRLLQQFIQDFKELDRALILLYLEDKSHREIAEILGITETNVATKISRIKDRLKQKFSTITN